MKLWMKLWRCRFEGVDCEMVYSRRRLGRRSVSSNVLFVEKNAEEVVFMEYVKRASAHTSFGRSRAACNDHRSSKRHDYYFAML